MRHLFLWGAILAGVDLSQAAPPNVVFIIGSAVFLTVNNLTNILVQSSVVGALAIGILPVILAFVIFLIVPTVTVIDHMARVRGKDGLDQPAFRILLDMLKDDRFADVKTTVEAGNPEIQIIFDQERASQLGLVVRDIADRLPLVFGKLRELLRAAVVAVHRERGGNEELAPLAGRCFGSRDLTRMEAQLSEDLLLVKGEEAGELVVQAADALAPLGAAADAVQAVATSATGGSARWSAAPSSTRQAPSTSGCPDWWHCSHSANCCGRAAAWSSRSWSRHRRAASGGRSQSRTGSCRSGAASRELFAQPQNNGVTGFVAATGKDRKSVV